jgi:hypothetical protein
MAEKGTGREHGPEMARVLARIRAADKPNPLYGRTPGESEACLKQVTEYLITGTGLGLCIQNEYRWFIREMSRLVRKDGGPELAFHIEMLLRKWQSMGLERYITEMLTCEVFKRFDKMQEPVLVRPVPDGTEDESLRETQHGAQKEAGFG